MRPCASSPATPLTTSSPRSRTRKVFHPSSNVSSSPESSLGTTALSPNTTSAARLRGGIKIMAFEHDLIKQQVGKILLAKSSDQGRIQYIRAYFANTVEQTQERIFTIFYLWQWLQQNSPDAADEMSGRYDDLHHLVGEAETLVTHFTTKVTGIAERWPEWTWNLGEYTPVYSGRMVETLVKLSRKIKGSVDDRRDAPLLLRQTVIERLRARGNARIREAAAKLQNADIEAVWRRFGGQTCAETTISDLLAKSAPSRSRSRSRSIEQGVAGPAPLPDASSSHSGTSLDVSSASSQLSNPSFALPAPQPDSSSSSSSFRPEAASTPQPGTLTERARLPPGHFAGQQGPAPRPAKRLKTQNPPPPLQAPTWDLATSFAAQRRYDEDRLAAATTDDEREAARANLDATIAWQAAMPPHFRGG